MLTSLKHMKKDYLCEFYAVELRNLITILVKILQTVKRFLKYGTLSCCSVCAFWRYLL